MRHLGRPFPQMSNLSPSTMILSSASGGFFFPRFQKLSRQYRGLFSGWKAKSCRVIAKLWAAFRLYSSPRTNERDFGFKLHLSYCLHVVSVEIQIKTDQGRTLKPLLFGLSTDHTKQRTCLEKARPLFKDKTNITV